MSSAQPDALVAEALSAALDISDKLTAIDLRRARGDSRIALRQARVVVAQMAQQLEVALLAGYTDGPMARPSPPDPP